MPLISLTRLPNPLKYLWFVAIKNAPVDNGVGFEFLG